MDLHFAEFQGSTCPCCPFRLSIGREVSPPVLYGLRVLVVSLYGVRPMSLIFFFSNPGAPLRSWPGIN
jgi:hypothetical protein